MKEERLILVREDLFTEDMAELHKELDKVIKIFSINNLKNGIEKSELLDAINSLITINDTIKAFSEKKFQDDKANTTILKYY